MRRLVRRGRARRGARRGRRRGRRDGRLGVGVRRGRDTGGATATAVVERRDLVLRDDVDGTLGYADVRTLTAGAPGRRHAAARGGDGRDARRGALRGERARGCGCSTGRCRSGAGSGRASPTARDVEQLERNLVELGHDPTGNDRRRDLRRRHRRCCPLAGRTRSASPRRARSRRPTPSSCRARGGSASSRPRSGRSSSPVRMCSRSTATAPVVEIDLDARSQELARVGAKVRVELPSGRRVTGTVAVRRLGSRRHRPPRRARSGDSDGVGRRPAGRPGERDGLDGAPGRPCRSSATARGTCSPCRSRRCSRSGAVETRSRSSARTASGRSTAVETGTFADGYVEVEGRGIQAARTVVVPE